MMDEDEENIHYKVRYFESIKSSKKYHQVFAVAALLSELHKGWEKSLSFDTMKKRKQFHKEMYIIL